MRPREVLTYVKETFKEWQEDDALQLGAALAYYTIFSLAPLLVVVIGIAGLAFGREAVAGRIDNQIEGLVGREGADAVQAMVASAGQSKSGGIIATIVGLAVTLFGASGVFAQLQASLNKIWEVEPKAGRGIMGIVKDRFVSFGMVLGIGFLLLVSLVVSAAVAALDEVVRGLAPSLHVLIAVVSFVVAFGLITLLFALIFRYVPDIRIAWRDVWIGAVVTALLFVIGKYLIGLYLGHSTVASTYGAAGSVLIVLLWVYYSTQILFLGAEFTQVWATRHGSRIVPSPNAERVEEVKVPVEEAGERAARPGDRRRRPAPTPRRS